MGRHHARHGRPLRAGAGARAAAHRPCRRRLPRALDQCRLAGQPVAGGRLRPLRPRCRRQAVGPRPRHGRARALRPSGRAPGAEGRGAGAGRRALRPRLRADGAQVPRPRIRGPRPSPKRCGIPAATIRRIAAELADTAFNQSWEIDAPWTDFRGEQHQTVTARPVSFHAMRGVSAHSNGFQTCRALHVLQLLLGAVRAAGRVPLQAALSEADRGAPGPALGRDAERAARRPASRLRPRARGSVPARRRQPGAHRQGVHLGGADVGARDDAHGRLERPCRRPVPDRRAVSSTWPTWPGTRR